MLDLMHAFHDSSNQGKHIKVDSTCDRPQALPMNLMLYRLDT